MTGLKKNAKRYWVLDLPVVPVEGKRPLIPWGQWQTKPQTVEEFEALPWDKADGFGVLCGVKAKNGFHLAIIDIDNPEFDLNLLRTTQIEKTPSGGYHFIYWSRRPVEPKKRTDLGLELLGLGNICIMAPSKGYMKINDNIPTEVESAEALFDALVVKLGGKLERETVNVKRLLQGVKVGERDNAAIRLATWYRKKGLKPEEAFNRLLEWDQKNEEPLGPKVLKEKIKSAFKLPEPYAWIFSDEPKEKTVRRVPFVELPDGCLAEEAYDGKKVYFLVYNPQTNTVEKLEEIETEDCIYLPIKSPEVEKGLTLLPSEALEYGSEEQLLNDIINFANKWHEAPSEYERKLDTLYVLMTYIYDLLPRLPYRRALGAYGRGKTAWLETVGFICYRPLILAGCSTDIAIVRRIDLWKGTALIDEADFTNSGLYSFITKILNIGYDRNLAYYQRANEVNPKRTLFFQVYGPKLLATRRPFKDLALESRCLTFIAREKTKNIPLYRDKQFMEAAKALRNKLILWRFRNYHKLKERISLLETPEFEKNLDLKDVSSRVKEIIGPLTLIGQDFNSVIQSVAEELEEQLLTDPEAQLERQFNTALLKIYDEFEESQKQRVTHVTVADDIYENPPQTQTPFLQVKLEDIQARSPLNSLQNKEETVLQIPLTKIAKRILGEEELDENILKGLNRKLSKMIQTRLGFRVFRGAKNKTFVEIPLLYITSIRLTSVTSAPRKRVIHIKAFTVVGPTLHLPLTGFLMKLKKAKLRWLVDKIKREGAFVERKGWFAGSLDKYTSKELLKAKIDEIRSIFVRSKAFEDIPFQLTDYETFVVCEKNALQPVKIPIESFNKESVPGCFGEYNKPIAFWVLPCNRCAWSNECLEYDLNKKQKKKGETFPKGVKIVKYRRYAWVRLELFKLGVKISPEGQNRIEQYILNYIRKHWKIERIRKQFFAVTPRYISFLCLLKDAERVADKIYNLANNHFVLDHT